LLFKGGFFFSFFLSFFSFFPFYSFEFPLVLTIYMAWPKIHQDPKFSLSLSLYLSVLRAAPDVTRRLGGLGERGKMHSASTESDEAQPCVGAAWFRIGCEEVY
jgi:hypothetical protein